MSDTPRTDAVDRSLIGVHAYQDLLEHARALERELAALRAATIEECAEIADAHDATCGGYGDITCNGTNCAWVIATAIRALAK